MESQTLPAHEVSREKAYLRQAESELARFDRDPFEARSLRQELAAELGIDDGALLDDLFALGITPATACAFEALPLVEVAWADGEVDPEERWRVLGVATSFGLELGRAGHALVELWLTRRPSEALFEAWYRFASLPAATARTRRLLEGCDEVASAAGGILGFRAVSASESEVIERVRGALWRPLDAVDASS